MGDVVSEARCYVFWGVYFVIVVGSFVLTTAVPAPERVVRETTRTDSSLFYIDNNPVTLRFSLNVAC
jgi:hypothetical protein